MTRDVPRELSRRPFTRPEALASGISDTVLRGERFEKVVHGVHALSTDDEGDGRTRTLRTVAGLQLVRPDAAASCLTACLIWGLPTPTSDPTVHVCASRLIARKDLTAHRRTNVDVTTRAGVLLTAVTQTFVDLAQELDDPWLLAIGDAMVSRSLTTPAALREAAGRIGPGRGARRARRVADLVRPGAESPMESLLRLTIVRAGLPEPSINVDARDDYGGWLARVDLSYPSSRIAVEYQGDHHRTDVRQWRADITRTRALQAAGWLVVLATADDIRRPTGLISSLRDALRDRARAR